jgi:hypothetical protein
MIPLSDPSHVGEIDNKRYRPFACVDATDCGKRKQIDRQRSIQNDLIKSLK